MMKFDIAIIGGGLAGLSVALHLAQQYRVLVISKSTLLDSASSKAQGGIAAVLDLDTDSNDQHIQDTLTAGVGLCDEAVTRFIVYRGKEAINWLIEQGVPFTQNANQTGYHLTREGGHSQRRIIHADDHTGESVQTTLEEQIRRHPNITVLEHHCCIDLITTDKIGLTQSPRRCVGFYVHNKQDNKIYTVSTTHTILATGGAGKVYLYTSNPDTSTGDGIAMAKRMGCRIANMEFMQFHPTCLYHPHAKSFLMSEALRGEGALLKLPLSAGVNAGQRFMPEHDQRAELAPRDIVARAIDYEMKKRGLDHVDLDISHKPAEFLKAHFPTIYAKCLEFGIDITKQPIPVVPAAHYTCGGVVTDTYGRTDLMGLYAVGEVAYTGLHGANRLASNSLLECVVLGRSVAKYICQQPLPDCYDLPSWDESRITDSSEEVRISSSWDELRQFMWNYVGIVRSDSRLQHAKKRILLLKKEIDEYYAHFRISRDLLELRNLIDVAILIVDSALMRQESRGLHYSLDYPYTFPKGMPTVLAYPVNKSNE